MPSRAYEDRIAGFRHSRHHALGNPAHAIGVDHFQVRSVQGSLEAASQKGIEEPIVQRNLSLRMLFRRSAVAGHLACDFIGQLPVPWLASPSLCQFSGDIGGAASIFALNRNHSNHDFARVLSNLGPSLPARGSFLRMMKASKNIMTAPKAST